MGLGDYPNLAKVGMDARDPYEDMDYYYWRRNYGEYIHIEADMFTTDRFDPNEITVYSAPILFLQFFVFVIGPVLLVFVGDYFDLYILNPTKPKQYPGPGKEHYTFEPLD